MKISRVLMSSMFATLVTFFLLPTAARAANVTVGCGVSGTFDYPSISAALAGIGQTGPSTITVYGACQENVSLNNARSITIIGAGGASVVEPTDSDAFDIFQSQEIYLENLDISTTGIDGSGVFITDASEVHIIGCNIHNNQTVGVNADTGSVVTIRNSTIQSNTPNDGLDVLRNSTATVIGSTIQNNGNSAVGGVGVFVTINSTILFRQTNLIQNNAGIGILGRNLSNVVLGGSGTTIQGHLADGVVLQEGSHLQVNVPGTLIQGNGGACPLDPTCGGVFATQNSTVDLPTGTITGNQGSGVSVQQGANVGLSGATVSNNTGDGVHVQWISIGNFVSGSGTTIIGNGGKSVSCDTTSLVVGDLSGFTNIGCNQIARSIGPPRPGKQ